MLSNSGKYRVLGIMSGTSLDGLDLALCEFSKTNDIYQFKILKAETVSYSEKQTDKLKNAHELNVESYFRLHHLFGKHIAREVNLFLKGAEKPDAIASHGHTIFHQPKLGFSTQIGCGATIAANTGITTVCDFRSLDVALNGQGAPLVPIGDKLLFPNYESCLNLGGIANISFDENKKRIAFDVCYTNMGLNYFAQKTGLDYDENGELAQQGECDKKLLYDLNKFDYFQQKGAKSLGREWFENTFLPLVEKHNLYINDTLNTLVHHTAMQIANVLNEHKLKNVLITGGGAHNLFLIKILKEYYKGEVVIPDPSIINFKEALIFAFLGMKRMNNEINTLSSVTGASADSIGGAVYQAPKQ